MKRFRKRSLLKELLAASPSSPVDLSRSRRGGFEYRLAPSSSSGWSLVRRPVAGGVDEEVLPNASGPASVSRDGRRVAFFRGGVAEEASWKVAAREVATGEEVKLPSLPGAARAAEWDGEGRFLFVSLTDGKPGSLRPCRVAAVDTVNGSWQVVAEENDPRFMIGLSATKDGAFLSLRHASHECSEYWALKADSPQEKPLCMRSRDEGLLYAPEHLGGKESEEWLVFSDNRLFRAASLRAPWQMLHHDEKVVVSHVECLSSHCVMLGYEDGIPCVISVPLRGETVPRKTLVPSATCLEPLANTDPDAASVEVALSSPLQIPYLASVSQFGLVSGTKQQQQQQDGGGKRVSHEKTALSRVPMTLIQGSDASGPVLLSVYGAYNAITPAEYDPTVLPLLARGWSLAAAHVRGSGLHSSSISAKTTKKSEQVADLIECASHFKGRPVVVRGSSAGAFTAAAALLTRPELYCGGLFEVPFLNAVEVLADTKHDALMEFERREWDCDVEDLKRVDPMEIVKKNNASVKLPPILLTCSESDARVSASSVERFADLARKYGGGGGEVEVIKTKGGHFDGEDWAEVAAEKLDFLLHRVSSHQ